MDRITKSLLDEFCTENGLTNVPEEEQFEHFATYLSITDQYPETTIDTAEFVTGAGGDTGIDGIGFIVNGVLITDPDEVKELCDQNGFLQTTMIFVQAERTSGFDSGKIQKFGFGVLDFFADTPSLPRNQHIQDAADVMGAIYHRSSKFKGGNPACKLFYVTTGNWTGDRNLEAHRARVVRDLKALNYFRDVELLPVGADAIQKMYRSTKNAIARDISFPLRSVVPEMPSITEAYVGLLPASEFLKLLDDGNGGILKSIFYDNVRDWQDYNDVNTEIRATLASPERARFAMMNNGVTVIAKRIQQTGNKFHVQDYQIVNGCQTSHVLFEQQSLLDPSVLIPFRLIVSDDDDVVAAIVKATNRQTEVKQEQLWALSDFQKKLEIYFRSFEPAKRLYYERRLRQYSGVSGIRNRIITPSSLIRSYAAMLLEEPHRTTRSYKSLQDRVGKEIFGDEHRLEPYYLAATALYQLESNFRTKAVDPKLKPARYHLLFAAKMLVNPSRTPQRKNSRELAKYCDEIASVFWDDARATDLFVRAAAIIMTAANSNVDRDHIRTEPFTDQVRTLSTARVPGRG